MFRAVSNKSVVDTLSYWPKSNPPYYFASLGPFSLYKMEILIYPLQGY